MLHEDWIQLFVELCTEAPIVSAIEPICFPLEFGRAELLAKLRNVSIQSEKSGIRTLKTLAFGISATASLGLNTVLGPSTPPPSYTPPGMGAVEGLPSHLATSSIFGTYREIRFTLDAYDGHTDALTATKRTCSPRVFILDTTTSRVAPLDSRRMCTLLRQRSS